jgi:hypothetical protein
METFTVEEKPIHHAADKIGLGAVLCMTRGWKLRTWDFRKVTCPACLRRLQ